MNKIRRKELNKIKEALSALRSDLEHIKYDEESCYDNMPEGIQCSMKGEESEEAIEILDEACDKMEEIIDLITEVVL